MLVDLKGIAAQHAREVPAPCPVEERNKDDNRHASATQDPIPSIREIRDDAPVALDLILQKMMGKEPIDRYQSMLT